MPHDLNNLGPDAFQFLVNLIAMKRVGPGITFFGPGADGGRDGVFKGTAPYPSENERWSGLWHIQSKFHAPHLTKNSQEWLLEQIEKELKKYTDPQTRREWPDVWIVATNVDPSGAAQTGSYDKAVQLIHKAHPPLAARFDIWGGSKIIAELAINPEIAAHFKHLLTTGPAVAELLESVSADKRQIEKLLRHITLDQLTDHKYAKLEQAGAREDSRPGLHQLFIDLPYGLSDSRRYAMRDLVAAGSIPHRNNVAINDPTRSPYLSKTWFIKAGPGRGKSTIGQLYSQIQRAKALAEWPDLALLDPAQRLFCADIKIVAEQRGYWPNCARIPIQVELKEYAQWIGKREPARPKGILTYLAERFTMSLEMSVTTDILRCLIGIKQWFFVFDGLDEVPSDVKGLVASEVVKFITKVIPEEKCDALAVCTSRPQGYTDQFEKLNAAIVELVDLSKDEALACASPLLAYERSAGDARRSIDILREAIEQPAVANLMQTPLQCHIMAVIVRSGQKPPERKWRLFSNFYEVIRNREIAKKSGSEFVFKLLTTQEGLLKGIHNRLGFALHSRAEKSEGANTNLPKSEFTKLVKAAVCQVCDDKEEEIADGLVEAATERLVLVNTPDSGESVRFDVRQLQEFFAGEYLYQSSTLSQIRLRLEALVGDQHWREAINFTIAAFIEQSRVDEVVASSTILSDLDVGLIDGDFPPVLAKRLGRGSIITLQLASDGLFEQDKRIRNRFSSVLRNATYSLSACTYAAEIRSSSVTYAWIRDTMLSVISEVNGAECWGSILVLMYLLEDDDPCLGEFTSLLNALSHDDLNIIIGRSLRAQKRQRKWFVVFVCRWLSRAPIKHVDQQILYIFPRLVRNIARGTDTGLENSLGSIWFFFSSFASLMFSGYDLSKAQVMEDFGPIKILKLDSTRIAEIREQCRKVLPLDQSDVESGSFMHVLWQACQAIANEDEASFVFVKQAIEQDSLNTREFAYALPWFFDAAEAGRAPDGRFQLQYRMMDHSSGKWESAHFDNFLDLHPETALSLVFNHPDFLQHRYPELRNTEKIKAASRWLVNNPDHLWKYFSAWGLISQGVGMTNSEFLEKFSSNMEGKALAIGPLFAPITLRDSDHDLLAVSVQTVIYAFDYLGRSDAEAHAKINKALKGSISNIPLSNLVQRVDISADLRTAVISMHFLSGEICAAQLLVDYRELVLSSVNLNDLLGAIRVWHNVHKPTIEDVALVARVFVEHKPLPLHLRSRLEHLFTLIRETSRFPSCCRDLERVWLSEAV